MFGLTEGGRVGGPAAAGRAAEPVSAGRSAAPHQAVSGESECSAAPRSRPTAHSARWCRTGLQWTSGSDESVWIWTGFEFYDLI